MCELELPYQRLWLLVTHPFPFSLEVICVVCVCGVCVCGVCVGVWCVCVCVVCVVCVCVVCVCVDDTSNHK